MYHYDLRGYQCFNKNRPNQQIACGGVAIYCKDFYSVTQIPLDTNIEAVAISVLYERQQISIINIYLPSNTNITQEDLHNLVQQAPSPRIILGDFNSHNIIWGSETTDSRGRLIEEFAHSRDLILLNSGKKTRFNAYSGNFSVIDLTFCDATLGPFLSWDTDEELYDSDHVPIHITNFHTRSKTQPTTHPKFNYKKANWEQFYNLIQSELNPVANPFTDIDLAVQNFTKLLHKAAYKNIPIIAPKTRSTYVPWWNSDCEQAINARNLAYKRLQRHNNEENLDEYKRLRAKAKFVIKKSKRESWTKFCSTINNEITMSELWRKVRSMKGISSSNYIASIESNGEILTENQDITEAIATFFENTSSDANFSPEFVQHKLREEQSEIENPINSENPINLPITLTELNDALKTCKNSTPGPDNIPYIFLRNLPPVANEYLLGIYNSIYIYNKFPLAWKTATILPIHKQGKSKTNISSYRPISLTCTMCKLLEKVISRRLTWCLERKQLLTNIQSGFRQNRSTHDNIITLESEITEAFLSQQKLLAVSIDIEKAFDMTWRHNIFKQLSEWHITGNILNYIRNFLTERTFEVIVNGVSSTKKMLHNGIPQGSVLSSLLFLIATNKISSHLNIPVKGIMFADDLVIYIRGKNLKTIETSMNQSLEKLQLWVENSGFKLSTKKTTCILFSKHKISSNLPNIKLYNKKIRYVNELNLLGVTFDNQLNWKQHLNNLKASCIKANNIIKVLAHQTWGADSNNLLYIYRCLVRSRIDYGAIGYASAKKTTLNKINSIQTNAVRTSLGAYRTSPVDSILCLASEPPLHYRRKQLTLTYATKIYAMTNNVSHKHTKAKRFQQVTQNSSCIAVPFYERVNRLLAEVQYQIPEMLSIQTPYYPPWTLTPKIDYQLTQYPKSDTHPSISINAFKELASRHDNAEWFYTDASSNQNAVGAAFLSDSVTHKYRLPPESSIFTAELFAIHQALAYILSSTKSVICICTDSLSSLQAIEQLYNKNPLVQMVQHLLHLNQMANKNITMIYVPSHVGIDGNEKADEAARQATEITSDPVKIYTHSDIKMYLKKLVNNLWQQSWNESSRALKSLKPLVQTKPYLPQDRKEQVVLTRLRIGHTRLTHEFLITRNTPPMCDICEEQVSVKHLLEGCGPNSEEESRPMSPSIGEILFQPQHYQMIMQHLKNSNIFNKI